MDKLDKVEAAYKRYVRERSRDGEKKSKKRDGGINGDNVIIPPDSEISETWSKLNSEEKLDLI